MSEPSDHDKRELWGLFCGTEIGRGSARAVYAHALDPLLVIKVESGRGSFQNVMEWEVWQAVRETEHARWFAPCVAISPSGGVLVQRRTMPAAAYPDRIPAFMADTKLGNYGILMSKDDEVLASAELGNYGILASGQFVCHDYGRHQLLERGMTRRMVKPPWWNLK